ncbi:MAG: ribose 5-phosphate isomerase B [Armatimonadota bacterium]|nr:ribose 5-phosphate isomerase B [Armatimonadota bacterium]MDR7401902.1 ribose 5-phosphate isomerase B [Armatimonadota bacterium]MDR7404517.1 ribose 5-phosphate isomerase B [Armatimonadota bacterium]MDR7438131.1 ribose 5-phosphate isomerase B [Armatimonadota bacterium]MDR7471547.1 ribose 5-phosphate isomerase B [Armatimonadota bacterium]
MKIAVASDHAGYRLKEEIKLLLREMGHEVRDFGTHSDDPVDYPDFVVPAAEAVSRGECDRGIVVGGSGNGEAIVANKVPGIRAALCHDTTTARLSRAHNDANVLALGQRITGSEVVRDIVRVWLQTPFEGGRHQRRLEKIAAVESRWSRAGVAAPPATRAAGRRRKTP